MPRQPRRQRVELRLVTADHDDVRAKPREQPCDRAPNPAGWARDHHDHAAQRIGCEHRALDCQLVVDEAECFWRGR